MASSAITHHTTAAVAAVFSPRLQLPLPRKLSRTIVCPPPPQQQQQQYRFPNNIFRLYRVNTAHLHQHSRDMPEYRNPALTVDALVVRKNLKQQGKFQILLIQRGRDPFKGFWAFPGGFVDYGEDPVVAVKRELQEETLLRTADSEQQDSVHLITVHGNPKRDPRQHIVTVAYALKVDRASLKDLKGSDDADDAAWFDLDTIEEKPMAFDHGEIVREFKQWFEKEGRDKLHCYVEDDGEGDLSAK